MTAHPSSAVLVGREADLAALRDALKRTRGGEFAAVLVGGEAGVGKTRLVEEFSRTASADGLRVLTGQCLELGEEGLPFAPFAAALRELARTDGPGVLDDRFAHLLPELGPAPETELTQRRGYLFDLVAGLFARISADRPLVLVLEDLHWADRSTRDLIGFLARSARLPQVLLVATYRTDELHRGHPLRPFLAELDRVRGVQRADVDRLDRDGTTEMLTHLLGTEPEPALADTVHDRAQGNPFFIEQFAASADPVCCDIPHSLRDLLLSRVDQLGDQAQRVLRVAAVGGTSFGHETLIRVAGMPEADLETALRSAVAAQLITVEADGGYEFRHALVREAVHDDLLPGEHARLHVRYAETLTELPTLVAAGRAPAEIAHHWHAARDYPRALVAARVAAGTARAQNAYAEQSRLLERVLDLWEVVGDAARLLDAGHVDLLEEAALAAIDAGDHQRALKLTRAALSDLDAAAEPLRAARLLVRRAKLLYNAGTSNGATEARAAYNLLRDAPDVPERVLLLADVSQSLGGIDDDLAAEVAATARASAAFTGDVADTAAAAITYGLLCAGRIAAEDGLPAMIAAADRARHAGDLPNLVRTLVIISDSLFELGRYAESAAAAEEGIPYADRVGVGRTKGVFLLTNHAEALIALGRWDEADARHAEAARLDPPGTLALPWLQLRARLRLARGHDGAQPLVQRAVAFLARPYVDRENRLSLLELRIQGALHAGDHATVLSAARMAMTEPGIIERPRYGWPLLSAIATAAASAPAVPALAGPVAAGSSNSLPTSDPGAGSAEILGWAAATAERMPRRYPADHAYAAHVDATVGGGPGRWRAAVHAWRADGQRYQLAVALLRLAEASAAAGERVTAAEALEEAAAISRALGAAALTSEADTLARRIGMRSAAHASVAGAETLTGREREVLRLVAEGKSNPRIAELLYISPKTASVHVSRIIAKLEVTGRGEAAAVAHRLGLLD
ncbi:AAA family ATPase [Actinoplanes sp. NPDC051494]|uniref:helix-turn-helix transcriptional regulator n=1 Tax=Actinoplanes sp. NPDC051494 TaxID=3363907 RepID=UPI003790B37D